MDKSIGDFFKDKERENRTAVPHEGFLVMRMDGKGFSKFTSSMQKPFDIRFSRAMITATRNITQTDAPVMFAYTQSDEISLIFNHTSENGQVWFGGQVQKLVSTTAAMATAFFNAEMAREFGPDKIGFFDSRVALASASEEEVGRYLQWRKDDAVKNSISMLAHHEFGTSRLKGVSTRGRLQMLVDAGRSWDNNTPTEAKAGTLIYPINREEKVTYTRRDTGEEYSAMAMRTHWVEKPMNEIDAMNWAQEIQIVPEERDPATVTLS